MDKNKLLTKLKSLPVFEYRGVLVADSRDVAAMIGRQHKDTLRTISTMCKHLSGRKIALSDFFISATYKDSTGRSLPCYYLAKKGLRDSGKQADRRNRNDIHGAVRQSVSRYA